MSAQELLSEIQKLPIIEQRLLFQKLARSLSEQPRGPISEDEGSVEERSKPPQLISH